jgi:CelD/BcsL family acetyltransferase involved in cellulose biosynthesis
MMKLDAAPWLLLCDICSALCLIWRVLPAADDFLRFLSALVRHDDGCMCIFPELSIHIDAKNGHTTIQRMRIEVATRLDQFGALRSEWTRLWKMHSRPELFQHPGWALAVVEAYGLADSLYVLQVLTDEGELIGICPLIRQRGRLTWLTAPRADYNDIICAAADAKCVVGACLAYLNACLGKEWQEVLLVDVYDESLWSRGFRQQTAPPFPFYQENVQSCWATKFDPAGETLRSITGKKGYKRNEKALAQSGEVRLKVWNTQEERLALLPKMFEQHIARWREVGDRSLFEEQSSCDFYRRLVMDAEAAEMIDFVSIQVGDRIVAHHFGFWGVDRMLVYKWSFDPAEKDAGPGTVLMVRLMERTVERGFAEFDFLRGGEGYKGRFANLERTNHDWRALASPMARILHETKGHIRDHHPRLKTCLKFLSKGDLRAAWNAWK